VPWSGPGQREDCTLNRTAAPHNARADPSTGAADPGGSGTGDGSALVDPRALGKRVTPGAKRPYPIYTQSARLV